MPKIALPCRGGHDYRCWICSLRRYALACTIDEIAASPVALNLRQLIA